MNRQQKEKWERIRYAFCDSSLSVRLSICVMGLGQLKNRQWMKGLLYLLCFMGMLYYMGAAGFHDLVGFITLGTREADPWLGIEGDNSVSFLIKGILTAAIILIFLLLHIENVRDALQTEEDIRKGRPLKSFRESFLLFTDKKFYVAALVVPVLGVVVFNIIPIVFMMLISFTNYGDTIIPPKLVDWVGFGSYSKIFAKPEIKDTFFKILEWNIIWAVATTFINYFGGLGLALLINKKCVKAKAVWRFFPILAYAVPGFITLLSFKFMLSCGGPINYYITRAGFDIIDFMGLDAGWTARIIGILVNAWLSIPTSMLLATSILTNMNTELYEAASIDGATGWVQFKKLTLPYVIFSTTPVLITNFINSFNNFGLFYFLRGKRYMDEYFLASDTDLLINWLYNLSIDNDYYSIGAAISMVIFMITSVFALLVYTRSQAYRKEDTFQ